MKKGFKKRKGLFYGLIFLTISFTILTANLKANTPSWIESTVVSIFSPIQNGVIIVVRKISNTVNRYYHLLDMEKKYNVLEKEYQKTVIENSELKEMLLKFKRLDTLYSIKNTFEPTELLLADVVGFDASRWSQSVIINRGTESLIKNNMAVIKHNGLVGRVINPMNRYSKELLITDSRSAIDALIQRNRDRGIVVGTNEDYCSMNFLSVNSDVVVGDTVISSGVGGTVQKGFVIGIVVEISDNTTGLFKQIKIQPTADMKKLEEVLVVLKPVPTPVIK